MKEEMLWPVAIQNPVTKEWLRVFGQGRNVAEVLKDVEKNLHNAYRPSSDGRVLESVGIGVVSAKSVRLQDGTTVNRKLEDFESEKPYDEAKEKVELPACEIPEYLNKPRPLRLPTQEDHEKAARGKQRDVPQMALL